MIETVIKDLGLIDYKEAWDIQKQLFEKKIAAKSNNINMPNYLVICEHPHVYTLGKSAKKDHLLINQDFLKQIGATSYEIERGGDITYHGPGQLVIYPIFDLEKNGIGIKKYVEMIEQCIINVLKLYFIESYIIPNQIGVWLKRNNKEQKIAAIGIKCSKFVSMHGLALNVNTDLQMFNHIVPCGIPDKEVASISSILEKEVSIFETKNRIIQEFVNIFDLKIREEKYER